MADPEMKDTKDTGDTKARKTKVSAESGSGFDVESAKAFMLKEVTINAPMWALVLIGILVLGLLLS
ncbi:MAG: hypothetical protein EOM26_00705 [Alphaproteobacteria bacterium]|nr:hypothetical protein [Alphaproteobacteria bacterium]